MPTPEPEKRVKRPRLRLPFEKRKQDAGSWTYDHRIGLCVTLIAYLVLMIAFVSSKIVVGRKPHTQGMYIDLQTLAELEHTPVDMFTTVFIGNAETKQLSGRMVTPRGYRG